MRKQTRIIVALALLYLAGFYGTGAWQASRACVRPDLPHYPASRALADQQGGVIMAAMFWPIALPFMALGEIRDAVNPSLDTCEAPDGD